MLTYTPDTHFECLPTRRTPRTFPLSDLRRSFIPFSLIRPTTLLYSVSSTPDHSIVPLPVLLPSRIDASALQDEHLFRIAPQVICLIVLSAPRSHKESERPTTGAHTRGCCYHSARNYNTWIPERPKQHPGRSPTIFTKDNDQLRITHDPHENSRSPPSYSRYVESPVTRQEQIRRR